MSTFTEGKDGTIVSTEEKQCPYCGMMVVAYATFCTNCGERIGRKKCPQCGKTAEADAKFCSECGARLDGGAAVQPQRDTHQYVDLGLPSGTLWATCNVGATNPEDVGDYFAWGETTPKSNYIWSTLKYCEDNTGDKFSKYNTQSEYGKVDNKTVLDPSDDAATANWGEGWCMPTLEQIEELKEKCTWNWIMRNGKNGYEVKGPNGHTLFLPAAGEKDSRGTSNVGSMGFYLSRSLNGADPYYAGHFWFSSSYVAWGGNYRCNGHTVRPVRCKN